MVEANDHKSSEASRPLQIVCFE